MIWPRILRHQFYLLQLENYDIGRYIPVVLRRFWPSSYPPRRDIGWTAKAVTVNVLALVLLAVFSFWPTVSFGGGVFFWFLALVFFAVLSFAYFAFLVLALILLWPLDFALKTLVVFGAKRKLRKFTKLKIIAVTGSYGKTTMKEILNAVLEKGAGKAVLKTPESVNTPLGVSRLILGRLSAQTEILIVEMGAYRIGEIKKLCLLTPPDIAVLTGINEAHLERFGNLQNTVNAKFEIVANAKNDALAVLNEDDALVKENYQRFLGGRRLAFYSSQNPKNYLFYEDGSGQSFDGLKVSLLGEYAVGMVRAAGVIAAEFGLSPEQICRGVESLRPIPHRLEPILNRKIDILVIDDSYNGNPDGAAAAIKLLTKFSGRRRKIYLTPGLVEMGDQSHQIHKEIGQSLAKAADLVILIKTSVSGYLAEGLKQAGFPSGQILEFPDTPTAHQSLGGILRPQDVILFQNDWPENYL